MSKRQKLLDRLSNKSSDFTYAELTKVLKGFGYDELQGEGSRVKFVNNITKHIISLHRPHPSNILKKYQIEDVIYELERQGLI
jgi:hypothetical protein